jgi:hypothetical protein
MKTIILVISILSITSSALSQTVHQKSVFQDEQIIANQSRFVSRSGDTLSVRLRNGQTKLYVSSKSEFNGHDWYYGEVFLFEGYLKKQGFFLVRQTWQDGDYCFLMIRETDGYAFSVIDSPTLSPNERYFVTASMDVQTHIKPNAIQVCEFVGDSISLAYNLEPKSWGPKDVNWMGNDSLCIVKAVPMDSTFDTYKESNIFLVRRATAWVLFEK